MKYLIKYKIFEKKKLTQDEFIEKAKLKHPETIEDDNGNKTSQYSYEKVNYIGSKDKVIITCHNKKWHKDRKIKNFPISPNEFLSGTGCNECSVKNVALKNTLNTSDFINKAKEIHTETIIDDNGSVVPQYSYEKSNYVKAKDKVIITCHNKKNHKTGNIEDFPIRPYSFLRSEGCPKCGKKNTVLKQSSNTDDFVNKAKEAHNETIIDDNDKVIPQYSYEKVNYIKNNTKVLITCHNKKWHKDGNIKNFLILPSSFLQGNGCRECGFKTRALKKTINSDVFLDRAIEANTETIIDDNGKIIPQFSFEETKYVNTQQKVIVICNNKKKHASGEIEKLLIKPSKILYGCICPFCRETDGEKVLAKTLKILKITNIPQKTFNDLKDKKVLRLDTYLPDLNCVIEYDGPTHFMKVYNNQDLSSRKKSDKLKDDYCKQNNIAMVRISFDRIKHLEEDILDALVIVERDRKKGIYPYITMGEYYKYNYITETTGKKYTENKKTA
jgi:hypothetical protein